MTPGKLCLCKNSPRFHQIASIKRSKNHFLGEHAPGPPSLPHVLHMDTYLLPNNPYMYMYNIILPPLGQKAEKKP